MDKLSASEALFGFMGWLTQFRHPVVFSQKHDAGLAADLVDEFCVANGLQPPHEGWADNCVLPTTRDISIDAYPFPAPIKPDQ